MRAQHAFDDRDRIAGVRVVMRDIPEGARAIEFEREERAREASRLRLHADRMERLERLKSDFLNLLSHELKAPLAEHPRLHEHAG